MNSSTWEKFKVFTPEEYENLKKRVSAGAEIIGDRWLSEEHEVEVLVAGYEAMTIALLNYEIEKDLLPI